MWGGDMTNDELDLLKANVDRQVEIETKAGERLRIKVLFVFDQESDPDVFFEVVPPENAPEPGGKPVGGYSLPLADILSVRAVRLP
jgi:hypothetical protein